MGKKYLVLDTETTGVFNRRDNLERGEKKAGNPLDHPEDYPRIFQLAYVLIDSETDKVIESGSSTFKPDGWVIPSGEGNEFWEEHGYSTDLCESIGVPAKPELEKLAELFSITDYIVAHNISFDLPIILSEFKNYGINEPDDYSEPELLCTMMSTIQFVKSKHSEENISKFPWLKNSYKFPKLEELYKLLFEETFDGAHDALVDVTATYKCVRELSNRGIISL